ncbi:hypothetical protein Hamer_G024964 [Homarus americanus]|uniref:Uncharacterized protein n=1 Tax=Homarus americanus TaxID=6706 RepID=A0A8J5MKT5_HOMAM|nr:hypothetical protein Hamer_G024964 [Homarus americanus]
MNRRPATTSLTTPKERDIKASNYTGAENKVLEALQRGNGTSRFKKIQEEDVNELLVSMADPLTSEKVLEMVEMAKKPEEEEEATDKPQTARQELRIPKLREFIMQVVEALNRDASTYSQLLDQMVMARQQKKTTSFFRPLSSPGASTPRDSDVDDELVELGSAPSEDDLPN